MARKTKQVERTEVRLLTPSGEIIFHAYPGMTEDLPALWQLRLEDTINAFARSEFGDAEFAMRLAALFTHLPDVPGNTRMDPKLLDRQPLTREIITSLVQAGTVIMPFLVNTEGEGEATAKNA